MRNHNMVFGSCVFGVIRCAHSLRATVPNLLYLLLRIGYVQQLGWVAIGII